MKEATLIAPSRKITASDLAVSISNLGKLGFRYVQISDLQKKHLYYAGSREERAKSINAAMQSPCKYVFSVRGGMGSIHTLDLLEKSSVTTPKTLCGFSDISLLLFFYRDDSNVTCIHGPNLGKKPLNYYDKLTQKSLVAALNEETYTTKILEEDIVIPGKAKAAIIGGNLSLIGRSLGTPWQVDAKDCIIFLEQNEYTERMVYDILWQCKQAGIFDYVKGVILGTFTNCGNDIETYLRDFFKNFSVPVIVNQPIGHTKKNLSVVLDTTCIIDTDKKSLTFYNKKV